MTVHSIRVVPVWQGELSVSGNPDVVLSCILGSCIATCLHDPLVRVGGMNHILLPGRRSDDIVCNRFGVYAMESLINELMHLGARRSNLVAKVFGGASTFENGLGIGKANAAFVRDFLHRESIPITAESVGGRKARRVRFFPQSGEAKELFADALVEDAPSVNGREVSRAAPPKGSGEIELF